MNESVNPQTQANTNKEDNLVYNPYTHKMFTKNAAAMAGFEVSLDKAADLKLPLFWDNGVIFGSKEMVEQRKVATLPGTVNKGACIHYEDIAGKTTYAAITEPWLFAKYKGIYLRPVSALEVPILFGKHSVFKTYEIRDSNFIPLDKAIIKDKIDIPKQFKNPVLQKIFAGYTKIKTKGKNSKFFTADTILWVYFVLIMSLLTALIIRFYK
ncbi:hypothetical protein GYA49_05520 [Candidatus Beckwithbacteria bacterium]|nr:hypothetical protein [Candidatus Beckwithbacteria bacterium]